MKIISFTVVIILLGIFSFSDSLSEDVLSNIKNAIVLNIASKYGNEGTVTASELKEFIGDVLSNEIEDEHTNNEACYERLIQDCQSGENLTACKEAIAEKVTRVSKLLYFYYGVIPTLRPPLKLFKSGLKDPMIVLNKTCLEDNKQTKKNND